MVPIEFSVYEAAGREIFIESNRENAHTHTERNFSYMLCVWIGDKRDRKALLRQAYSVGCVMSVCINNEAYIN